MMGSADRVGRDKYVGVDRVRQLVIGALYLMTLTPALPLDIVRYFDSYRVCMHL